MNIKKSLLLNAMEQCIPGVESGTAIIEGVDTFVFNDKYLHSYNDILSVTVPLPEPGLVGTVKSQDFYKLVNKLKEEDTVIKIKDDKWVVKNGNTTAKISLMENKISKFIEELNIKELKLKKLPEDFMEGLQLCSIVGNPSVYAGVYVDENVIVSTDMRRMNYFDIEKMDKFFIDDYSVMELLKFKNIKKYSVSGNWVHFATTEGAVFSSRIKDMDTYPIQPIMAKREAVKKEKGDLENKLPPNLLEVIDRVSTLAKDFEGNSGVKLTFLKEEIEVESKRVSGEIFESIPLVKPFKEDVNLPVWVDVPFLKEAIKKVPDFYIKKSKGKANGNEIEMVLLIFSSEKYTQIVSTFNSDE